MKKFLTEFKEFINQGNVMELAVAVVMGAAFTAIVNSVVSDLITPFITSLLGGIDFSNMKLVIPLGAGESSIAYGNFLNAVIQFLIIAFVIFLMVKGLNKLKRASGQECADNAPKAVCPFCKEEIKEGATRCPHCTAELHAPAKALN